MKLRTIIFFASCFLLGACSNRDANKIFEKNIDIPDGEWKRDEPVTFRFEIKDPTLEYDFYYNIRNRKEYKFSNLYVKFYLEDTLGNTLMSKEQQMYLFDPKTGKPEMDAQSGGSLEDLYEHRFPCIKRRKLFEKAGTYQFRVVQTMRDNDPIENILSVGLRIDDATIK